MDHSELVAELAKIEKLTAAERLKMARDRRAHQLRVFEQNERDYSKMNKSVNNQRMKNLRNKSRSVRFVHSVMLLEAAARNDIEEVRRLLMQGVSPDSTNEDGLTALHQCCIDDSETMMKLLLEFGADVNSEDSEKWTPLHAAATCGHLHLVKYLISKNANLLAVNADGNMPYDICEDEPTLDYIESEMASRGVTQELIDATRASTEKQMLGDLKSRNERLEFRNAVGATPLHIAAANGYLSVVEFLLDQHVATDVKDNDGWQPIHAAACWGHPDVLELLVQNGADLNAQTKNHETPFDICEDPDLKLKIAALRSEQETRARADNQKNRRSQSLAMNTRTHSVRRNSTRDKTLTSKKKIKDEAIIGIQDDDNKMARLETKPSPEQSQRVSLQSAGGDVESFTTSTNNGKRAAPPPPTNKYVENGSLHSNLELTPHYFSPQILTASALSDNKIDIHVSVTISTNGNLASNMSSIASPMLPSVLSPVPSLSGVSCTLADLKKQRSQSRTIVVTAPVSNSCSVTNSPFIFTELETHNDSNGNSSTGLAHVDKDSHKVNKGDKITSSSNAAISMTKFRGETAELVGTKEKQEACCIIL